MPHGWDVSRLARKFIMAGDQPLAAFKVVAHLGQARDAIIRLAGEVLAQQSHEWTKPATISA